MTSHRPVPGSTEHRQMRRKQWVCIAVLLGLIVLLLSGAGYFCMFRSVPLEISKETTYITEPLKSNGKEVDYCAAWRQATYPENLATEENGFRLILQHLGAAPYTTPEQLRKLCAELNLDANRIRPGTEIMDPVTVLRNYVESDQFDPALIDSPDDADGDAEYEQYPIDILRERLRRPWTLDDLPMLKSWLAENGPALDVVSEAVRKPTFHAPNPDSYTDAMLIALGFEEASRTRSYASALCARARYRVGTGDIDGAIDDVVACKRLGRHVGHWGALVKMFFGVNIEDMAGAVPIAGSLEHPPTKEQLQRLVDEFDGAPPKVRFEQVVLVERYATLDVVQTLAAGKAPLAELELPLMLPPGAGLDWSQFAARINEHFDSIGTNAKRPSPSWSPKAVISLRARTDMVVDAFHANMLSTVTWIKSMHRSTCADRLHRITLAMLLYERDHGTLPPAYTADAQGEPLHSWRVALLPYLGEQELYSKIRHNEPWDSDYNRQFHQEEVPFYQCPSAELTPGRTTYSVVVGPDMPFEAAEGKSLSPFGPKSANMILIVERRPSVCWMNPTQEISQSAANRGISEDGRGLGSNHPGGICCGFRGGDVQFLSDTIDHQILKGFLRGTEDRMQ